MMINVMNAKLNIRLVYFISPGWPEMTSTVIVFDSSFSTIADLQTNVFECSLERDREVK